MSSNLSRTRSFAVGNNETAIYHLALILNPTSDTAQRYASLLDVGVNLSGAHTANSFRTVVS